MDLYVCIFLLHLSARRVFWRILFYFLLTFFINLYLTKLSITITNLSYISFCLRNTRNCWELPLPQLRGGTITTGEQEVADELLHSLDGARRESWMNTLEGVDNNRSSRKAWDLLGQLAGDNISYNRAEPPIFLNNIASHIASTKVKRELTPMFRRHPLIHCGKYDSEWLARYYTDILQSGQIPYKLKRNKIVAILKLGKSNECPPKLPSDCPPKRDVQAARTINIQPNQQCNTRCDTN